MLLHCTDHFVLPERAEHAVTEDRFNSYNPDGY